MKVGHKTCNREFVLVFLCVHPVVAAVQCRIYPMRAIENICRRRILPLNSRVRQVARLASIVTAPDVRQIFPHFGVRGEACP